MNPNRRAWLRLNSRIFADASAFAFVEIVAVVDATIPDVGDRGRVDLRHLDQMIRPLELPPLA